MRLLRIIRVSRFVYSFFKTQSAFNETFIDKYLQQFYDDPGNRVKDATLQKIKKYYCLGIPVTSASYKKIYGKQLSAHERILVTLTGIVTPIIDDFTDEKSLDHESLQLLTSDPANYQPKSLEEKIVKEIICELVAKVPDAPAFLHAVSQTIEAQRLSEKQLQDDVTYEELLEITLEKGAWSHILFHYLVDEVPTVEMVSLLGKMGGMLQMSNDIFDVYKDFKDGIKTIPNTCADYEKLELFYIRECRTFCALARQLPYQQDDVEFFITFISFVMARGLVALKMLKKLQRKIGPGKLPFENLERSQLICDMEKPANVLRTALYTLRITKP